MMALDAALISLDCLLHITTLLETRSLISRGVCECVGITVYHGIYCTCKKPK